MFNSKYPLWLPPGSVRALLALSLTAAAIAFVFVGKIPADQVTPLAMAAIGFYFGGRNGTTNGS